MKSFLILLSIVAAAYGGVGVVTPEIEREALRLWELHCNGRSEGGQDGNTFIYCKRARGTGKQSFEHTVNIGAPAEQSEQVIFVKAPAYHYKHDVIVTGGGVAARKTVIYVKPAKNTHEVNVQDNTSPGQAPQKPSLYFLKGNHGEGPEVATESSPQTAPTQPPPTYLPPTNTYLPPTQPTAGYNYAAPSRQLRFE